MNTAVGASGERSIAVGRDAINSIFITGDHNQVFGSNYERLTDLYVEPWQVLNRVGLDQFTGRGWLLAQVDTFLREVDRGYLILVSDAGLGKTTFLAWLARERAYIHHFSELKPGLENVGPSLKSLDAQLILAYNLDQAAVEGVLPSAAAAQPDYFYRMLNQAAQARRPGEKIVLVIDALDEAGTPAGQNVLGLPKSLPEGVYIIASQRPVPVTLQVDAPATPRRYLELAAGSPENLADMRAFLEKACAWPEIAAVLAQASLTPTQVIETLLQKSAGVWIYLHFVVDEIARGLRSPLRLEALPNGMTQYYIYYWQRWREDAQAWSRTYLPLLSLLAAAQEPVTIDRLLAWSQAAAEPAAVRRLFTEQWRPFLATATVSAAAGAEIRYRFYHATLVEFFRGQIDGGNLSPVEVGIIEELAEATRRTHSALADRFLTGWGGLKAGLPVLHQRWAGGSPAGEDESYGVRHITAHLEGAGCADELMQLLSLEWVETAQRTGWAGVGQAVDWLSQRIKAVRLPPERRSSQLTNLPLDPDGSDDAPSKAINAWYTIREQAGEIDRYRGDLERAARLAGSAALSSNQRDQPIARLGRLALMAASLNSFAGVIPPALLDRLVSEGVWTPLEGLAYARQAPDLHIRAEALAVLAQYAEPGILNEINAAARGITDGNARSSAILGASHAGAAVGARITALVGAARAPAQTGPERARLIEEAQSALQQITIPILRGEAAVRLLPLLTGEALAQTLEIAIKDADAKILAGQVADLPEPHLSRALTHCLSAIQPGNRYQGLQTQIDILSGLGPALAKAPAFQTQWENTAETILETGEEDRWQFRNADPTRLAGYSPAVTAQLIDYAKSEKKDWDRAGLLAGLAAHLPLDIREQTWAEALRLRDRPARVRLLSALAPWMSPDKQPAVLYTALRAARSLRPGPWAQIRIWLYHIFIVNLPDGLAPSSGYLQWRKVKAEALARLAPHLLAMHPEGNRVNGPPALPPDIQNQLKSLRDSGYDSQQLNLWANGLPQPARVQALRRAVRSLHIDDRAEQAEALIDLAAALPPSFQRMAVQAAQRWLKPEASVKALARLAPHLTEPLLSEAMQAGLDQVRAINEVYYQNYEVAQAQAVSTLAPYLSIALVNRAVADAHRYRDANAPTIAYEGLIPRLADLGDARRAVELAASIPFEGTRNEICRSLPTQLPNFALQEALAAVLAQRFPFSMLDHGRANLLAGLVPRLAAAGYTDEAIIAANNLHDNRRACQALSEAAPDLPKKIRDELLPELLKNARLLYPGERNIALMNLAPYLSPAERQQIIREERADRSNGKTTWSDDLRQAWIKLPAALAREGYLDDAQSVLAWLPSESDRLEAQRRLDQLSPGQPSTAKDPGAPDPEAAKAAAWDAAFRRWQQMLDAQPNRSRRDLLKLIRSESAGLASLGGQAALAEIFSAVIDAGRWWP